ncbi:hypothetical protein ACMA5I_15575 [Paracoccaceae bacterium GXU_MW_L88]
MGRSAERRIDRSWSFGVPDAVELLRLEECWEHEFARTKIAMRALHLFAVSYGVSYVKFWFFVSLSDAYTYELIIFIVSAILVLPSLGLFLFRWRQLWTRYRAIAKLTGHPGTVEGAARKDRIALFLEFRQACGR